MARIQVLELPMVTAGDATETPFVLLVDQVTEQEAEQMRYQLDSVSQKCGARAAILSTTTLDLA